MWDENELCCQSNQMARYKTVSTDDHKISDSNNNVTHMVEGVIGHEALVHQQGLHGVTRGGVVSLRVKHNLDCLQNIHFRDTQTFPAKPSPCPGRNARPSKCGKYHQRDPEQGWTLISP